MTRLRPVWQLAPPFCRQALRGILKRLGSPQRLGSHPRRSAAPCPVRKARLPLVLGVGSAVARGARSGRSRAMCLRQRAELFRDAARRGRVPLRQAANTAKPISCNYGLRNFNIASIELALGRTRLFVGGMVDVTRWIESSLHDVAADQRAATPAALPGVVGCSSYPASCCPGPRVAAPAAPSESSAGAKHDGLAVNEDTFPTGTGAARLLVANSTAVESCDAR